MSQTFAQKYKQLARVACPAYPELTEGIDDNMSHNQIDDIVFRRGEYVGGMATALLNLAGNMILHEK